MRISFFHTPKPKQFTFRPRYYDERKEEMDNIRKKYTGESGQDALEMMRVRLDRQWRRGSERSTRRKSTGITMLIYIAIALMLLYFVLR